MELDDARRLARQATEELRLTEGALLTMEADGLNAVLDAKTPEAALEAAASLRAVRTLRKQLKQHAANLDVEERLQGERA